MMHLFHLIQVVIYRLVFYKTKIESPFKNIALSLVPISHSFHVMVHAFEG